MHQTASQTPYLHVFDVDCGLWLDTRLGSVVSPHVLAAMNLILEKDGILAFIGTRLEFGSYVAQLDKRRLGDSTACWISLPASTIMSMLGLSLSIVESGKPEMVFYGSPLTVALALLLYYRDNPMDSNLELILGSDFIDPGYAYHPNDWVLGQLGVPDCHVAYANELHIAKAYS
jgi:hypothetical protein